MDDLGLLQLDCRLAFLLAECAIGRRLLEGELKHLSPAAIESSADLPRTRSAGVAGTGAGVIELALSQPEQLIPGHGVGHGPDQGRELTHVVVGAEAGALIARLRHLPKLGPTRDRANRGKNAGGTPSHAGGSALSCAHEWTSP